MIIRPILTANVKPSSGQTRPVGWTMRDNKTKLYRLQTPETPEVTVTVLTEDEIKANREKFRSMIEILGEVAGEPVLNADRITGAEICLYYTWGDKK